jgi:hypothetical protein
MAVTVNVTLGWCRVAQASRAELSTNLMPGGLIELADFTPEEAKDALGRVLPGNRLHRSWFLLTR